MEVLGQVQALVKEHALTIGLGLLVAVILAGVAWYSMSRVSSGSKATLVNQARVNEASMNTNQVPIEQEEAEHQSDIMQQVQGDMETNTQEQNE